MAYIKETGRGERDARGSGRVVVVAAGQECVCVCVCVVRVAKEMHAHGHGGNERKKRSQHPPQGPASDVAAGRMDGWLALQ